MAASDLLSVTISALNVQSVLVFLFIFLLAVILFNRKRSDSPSYPPGPPALPLLGSVPFLGRDIQESVRKLAMRYGDVMTVYLGSKPAVILSSYDAIKEAFATKGNSFARRPSSPIIETYMSRGWGVVQTNDQLWQEHRRFTMSVLRDFGMGKAMLEDRITGEIQHFLEKMQQTNGKPFDPRILLSMAVSNVIHSIMFGDRWDYEDPDMHFHMETFDKAFEIVGANGLIQLFPSIIHFPIDLVGFWKLEARIRRTKQLERDRVAEHRRTYDPDVTRDFVDAYLHEIRKREDIQDSFHDDQMMGVLGDLFGAGTETTSTTLRWAIALMIWHPEVQQKVQAEIDEVIGRGRLPSMKDRLGMPYTDATLLEIQRIGTIVPFGVPHENTEGVTIQGHFIPPGTFILANLYAIHRDPKLWTKPEKFDPDRFLQNSKVQNGVLNKKENLIPFSIGKRACLGEALARMELFLFFTTMLQHLYFSNPPECPLPSLKGILGATYGPYPFDVVVTVRD